MILSNVEYPNEILCPPYNEYEIIRPHDVQQIWGYPTSTQFQIISLISSMMLSLSVGVYLLTYKKSNISWWKKILKFVFAFCIVLFYFSSTAFIYFDIWELSATIGFAILLLMCHIVIRRNNKKTERGKINKEKRLINGIEIEKEIETEQTLNISTKIKNFLRDKNIKWYTLNVTIPIIILIWGIINTFIGIMAEIDVEYCITQPLVFVGIVIGYFLIKLLIYKCIIQYKKKATWKFIGLLVIIIVILIPEIVGFCVGACIIDDNMGKKERLKESKKEVEYFNVILGELNSLNDSSVIQAIKKGLAFGPDNMWNKTPVIEKLIEMARKGNSEAQFMLGLCYDGYDFYYGVYEDHAEYIDKERSAYWYLQAAEQGHAKAQVNLAIKYAEGDGVKRDYEEAVKLFAQSAENGNPYAWLHLGDIYRDGVDDYNKGVILEKNIVRAKYCWQMALKLGEADVKRQARKRLEKIYD